MAHTLLLVDDDEHLMHVVALFFELEGYNVVRASTGKEAMDLLQQMAPDAMLLDVKMPDIDGVEVCRQVRAHKKLKDLPIIAFTAVNERMEQIKEAGADRAIAQPYSLEGLGATVKELLQGDRASRS